MERDLVTTAEAAVLAGTSRQAVLQASRSKSGKLPVARQGPHGEKLFERPVVIAWAATVRKSSGRRRPGAGTASRAAPARSARAEPSAGSRTADGRSATGIAPVPPAVLDALLEKVTSPEVLAEYRAVLLDDAAARRLAAKAAFERVECDRLKVQADRRRLERELHKEERENNVRQIVGRFERWVSSPSGRPGEDAQRLVGLGRQVLGFVGDERVAELAAGGASFEQAFLRAHASCERRSKERGGLDPATKDYDRLAYGWIDAIVRPSKKPVPPEGA
jgi:hypothetical protein